MKRIFKKDCQIKIVYGILAAMCFVLLYTVTCRPREGEAGKKEYQVVVFGDSILGGQPRDEGSLPGRLGAALGKSVYNATLGGTCMSRLDKDNSISNTKDALSMAALSGAIAAGDFGVQQMVHVQENATEYFQETIDGMGGIDFSATEIIFLEYGMNDYHAGVPVYSGEDLYDEYTFTGALRSTVKKLQKAYPQLKIVLLTPTYSWYTEAGLTCEEYDLGGGILEEYVEAEIELAREMGVQVIDLYHDVYVHEQWEDWKTYTVDGVHPNEAGGALLLEKILEAL